MGKLRSLFRRQDDGPELVGPVSEESLRQWLVERLARQVKVPPDEIDTSKSFEAYGLDSMVAVQVSGSLEKIVERRLSPGLLYEHQTIDDLSRYLAQELDLADPAADR
jgi:acyl carrier protein